jgi:transcriptional regulator of aroF, aroG, tyrA and aromatic amino acid transport
MKSRKFCLYTENITGITHTITGILADLNIDILAMEVIPGKVFIKIAEEEREKTNLLLERFAGHEAIFSVEDIPYLPIEMNEKNLEAALGAINDLVIAVDLLGNIIMYNPAAENTLQTELLHSNLGKLVGKKNLHIAKRILKGESFSREEIRLSVGEKQNELFFLSARALLDEDESLIGALLTFIPGAEMREIAFRIQRPELNSFEDIIYRSQVMEAAIQRAKQSALSDAPVMIRGESGTGKELFARAIHNASVRKKMPFVPINCAAIPDTLLESELFGYEAGAFTGAGKRRKMGLVELAEGGSLFLDEVGELPLQIQAKLLRVLQDGKVRRIGGHEENRVNFRVIVATNKNLEQMVQTKQFRPDLYYRLNVIPVDIPPLRDRKEDIPLLVENFLEDYSQRNGLKKISIDSGALEALMRRSWPGNVRELENNLERALSQLRQGAVLTSEMFFFDNLPESVYKNIPGEFETGRMPSLSQVREAAEKALLQRAVKRYGSTRKIAAALQVSHMTIANKLKKYGL